jgi:hypothetical protein
MGKSLNMSLIEKRLADLRWSPYYLFIHPCVHAQSRAQKDDDEHSLTLGRASFARDELAFLSLTGETEIGPLFPLPFRILIFARPRNALVLYIVGAVRVRLGESKKASEDTTDWH